MPDPKLFFTSELTALQAIVQSKGLVSWLVENSICLHVSVIVRNELSATITSGAADLNNHESFFDEAEKHFSERPAEAFGEIALTLKYEKHSSQTPQLVLTPDMLCIKIEIFEFVALSLEASDGIHRFFPRVDRTNLLLENIPLEHKRVLDVQQAALSSMQDRTVALQDVVTDMTIKQADYIQTITESFNNQSIERESRLNEQIEKERDDVRKRSELVDQRESELNLRENRGVRRELLGKIDEAIKKQNEFSFTKSTWKKSAAVHTLCIVGMLIGIALACSFLVPMSVGAFSVVSAVDPITASEDLTPSEDPTTAAERPEQATGLSWFQFAPFPAGLILFGSTFVFYARWTSSWFRTHAQSELSNLQYGKDILRASWITELIFESAAHQVDGESSPVEVPQFLIEQFCANLFQFSDGAQACHPLEDLQKYAKKFKKFGVSTKGVEVEFADGAIDSGRTSK